MQRAIELAHRNAQSRHGGPFGAIVADSEGRVIGEGVNGITSRADPVAHAEVMAIRQSDRAFESEPILGLTLYYGSNQPIGKSLIESVGIEKVYYGLSHAEMNRFACS